MALQPRMVLVHRRHELEELMARHGTRGQVEFFLRSRGRTLAEVQDRFDQVNETLATVRSATPESWRRAEVERGDLHRFLMDPLDIIVVAGPDGLVANVAKYLDSQPVVGVNPEPGVNPGVLVQHRPEAIAGLIESVAEGTASQESLTMVAAELDDGQELHALNEIFVGHPSHQSARYRLNSRQRQPEWERQSSSGLIVSTGTGATGWMASITREREAPAPNTISPRSKKLAWYVREAWPSPQTGTSQTGGSLANGQLEIVVESDQLVVFGDGMESDRLLASWGQRIEVKRSERVLRLVTAG